MSRSDAATASGDGCGDGVRRLVAATRFDGRRERDPTARLFPTPRQAREAAPDHAGPTPAGRKNANGNVISMTAGLPSAVEESDAPGLTGTTARSGSLPA